MNYSIIECINGNYFIRAEGITDIANAKTQYHGRCQALWDAQDVESAMVAIMDENLDIVERYKEFIHHDAE